MLAHGFGSGLGLWGPTVDALIQQAPARRVVAFDWLGMGGSSRPEFTKRRGCHPDEVVDESEAFFWCVGAADVITLAIALIWWPAMHPGAFQ